MKTAKWIISCALILMVGACGNMSNNTNEDHANYTDSSGMNADNAGHPDAGASMRDVYQTDSTTSTSGPDNAAPMSSATDSTQGMQQNTSR